MAVLIQKICRGMVLLLLMGAPAMQAAAETLQLQEQEIKAGLLYNFLKYTEWPALSSSLVVCVYGEDPFGGYLQPINGRSVNQHEIALRAVHAVGETGACQLLFVNAAEKEHWPELQRFLFGKPVLTVSDFEGFAGSGGMIEFGRKNDHISVELNIEAVTAAHLQVGDRLLKLVTVVHSQPPEGGR